MLMGKKILKNVMIACLMVISFTVHTQKVEAFEFGRGENNISQELYKIGSTDTECKFCSNGTPILKSSVHSF